jgi:homogentisate 1,2-dioxygenase
MFPQSRGRFSRQAHCDLPEGTYEEEFGRQGFFGPASHLYHAHAPTEWLRIEGPLRPRAYDLRRVEAADALDPSAGLTPVLGNQDLRIKLSRRTQAMPTGTPTLTSSTSSIEAPARWRPTSAS